MEERIEILLTANLIDSGVKDSLLSVIEVLDEKFCIKLTEENGSNMITHLGRALMRVKTGEIINGVNEEIINEIEESDNFGKVKKMYEEISKKFHAELPKNEIEYMYVNLMFLIEG